MSESMHEKMMRLHGTSGSTKPGHSGAAMKKASFEVTLKGKKQIAEGTMTFIFEKPRGFTFRAGQHVRMTLIDPPETDDEGDSRFFSIASAPQDKDLVFAMRMRDTAFKRVLNHMPTGQKVLIQILLGVPHGALTLHEDASKPAVFIVGGIGIVPVYSIIKDACMRKLPHKLYLFYSNRRPEDAPFLDELQKLAKQNPNFNLIATMTEAEKSARSWRGETGRIDNSTMRKYLDNFESPIYYLAGLPEMVSAMKTLLANLGVPESTIHAEEFTGFNLNELPSKVRRQGKGRLVIALAALAVLAFVIVHIMGATSVFHGLGSFSFDNPASYIVVGFILVIIMIKLKLFSMGNKYRKK